MKGGKKSRQTDRNPDSSICLKKGLVKIFSLTSPDDKLIVVGYEIYLV